MNILSICKEKFMNEQINFGTLTGYFHKTWIPKEVSGFSETYIDALEDTMHKFQIDYVESGVFTDKWLDKTVRDLHVAFAKYKESLTRLQALDSSVQFTIKELAETRKIWDGLLDAYTNQYTLDNGSSLHQYECSMEELQAANNSVITQHNHASNFYYYGRFVTECLEKWNRMAAGAPNEIILTSDEDPVGLLCVGGYKYTEAVKVAAGLWCIPVVYYNRDKNCITRQFVEQVY